MLEQQMIDVDGATLEVFFGGSGDPLVCCSHPLDAVTADLAPWWGWESGMGRLVGVNPRGVGQSSGTTPGDFTFRQHVDDLEAVRERLGIDQWVFWGISGGGIIALLYALAYPSALRGVVVAETGPSGRRLAADERSELSPHNPKYRSDLGARPTLGHHPAVLASLYPNLAAAQWVELRENLWLLTQDTRALIVVPSGGTERFRATFEEFVAGFDVEDRLGEIQLPTLIVASDRDELVPFAHCERLRDGIPHAEFVVLEGSGHGIEPVSANGEKYRTSVRNFLATIATRPAMRAT
jgi:pimeloyl-ACP methyl ester carboxylesterase